MKKIESNYILEPLEHIHQVDAPPFLFTRIEQRIKSNALEKVTPVKLGLITASFLLVLLINIIGVSSASDSKNSDLLYQLNLQTNYDLYQ